MSDVLIVDDDEDLRDLITIKLRRCGFDVRQAKNADEASRAVADDAPDLVLLDIMMPGISGLDLLERWRGETATAHLPVVMLSAKAQDSEVAHGLELGADDYIVKPFRNNDLVDRVNEILERSKP